MIKKILLIIGICLILPIVSAQSFGFYDMFGNNLPFRLDFDNSQILNSLDLTEDIKSAELCIYVKGGTLTTYSGTIGINVYPDNVEVNVFTGGQVTGNNAVGLFVNNELISETNIRWHGLKCFDITNQIRNALDNKIKKISYVGQSKFENNNYYPRIANISSDNSPYIKITLKNIEESEIIKEAEIKEPEDIIKETPKISVIRIKIYNLFIRIWDFVSFWK